MSNTKLRVVLLLAVALIALGLPIRAVGGDGASVYKVKCAACHAADGSGITPMGKSMKIRDLHSADVQKQSDAQLTTIVNDGKGKMPGYKGKLTADEVKAVVAYIRTMK